MSFWAGFEKRANFIGRFSRGGGISMPHVKAVFSKSVKDSGKKSMDKKAAMPRVGVARGTFLSKGGGVPLPKFRPSTGVGTSVAAPIPKVAALIPKAAAPIPKFKPSIGAPSRISGPGAGSMPIP